MDPQDVNFQQNNGDTALTVAAFWGHFDAARALLEIGADPLIRNGNGLTALMLAEQQGHIEVIRLLREWEMNWKMRMIEADNATKRGRDFLRVMRTVLKGRSAAMLAGASATCFAAIKVHCCLPLLRH